MSTVAYLEEAGHGVGAIQLTEIIFSAKFNSYGESYSLGRDDGPPSITYDITSF